MVIILYNIDSFSEKPLKTNKQTLSLSTYFVGGKGKSNFQDDNKKEVDIFTITELNKLLYFSLLQLSQTSR